MKDMDVEFSQKFIIEGQLLQYCGPIFFMRSRESDPTGVFNNGTFGLIDTGEKKLLVTCAHVWTEFQRERSASRDVTLAILLGSGRPIIVTQPPIDVSIELDIATFDMESLLTEFTERQFFPIHEKAIPNLKPGDVLTTLGYLGENRLIGPEGANFRYESLGIFIADISGPYILVNLTNTKRFSDSLGCHIPEPESHGGMSGSPVWLLRHSHTIRLAGLLPLVFWKP